MDNPFYADKSKQTPLDDIGYKPWKSQRGPDTEGHDPGDENDSGLGKTVDVSNIPPYEGEQLLW